jgi:SAM-dependent methyltransferase
MSSIKKSPGARTFGCDPAAYDAARPGYPPELFAWLCNRHALGPETRCFEIGAGTGQATRPILSCGVRSVFVMEPDPAFAGHLSALGPRVSVAARRFEDTPLPPHAYDFGFAATTFHWVKRMKALAQCQAALAPGGGFAMWWNVYSDPASPDLIDAAVAPYFTGLEQSPRMGGGVAFALDAKARLGEMRKAGFVNLEHRLIRWSRRFTARELSALYSTFSRVQVAPGATRQALLDAVARIVNADFGGHAEKTIITSIYSGKTPGQVSGAAMKTAK